MGSRRSISRSVATHLAAVGALFPVWGSVAAGTVPASSWRLANAEETEAWRVRSVQFFEDEACSTPIPAVPNRTGTVFATEAAEMTGAEHALNPRSLRAWESAEHCPVGHCHLGFTWNEPVSVRCVILQQGEPGLHAPSVSLQRQVRAGDAWVDEVTWSDLEGGQAQLALSCPAPPPLESGQLRDCSGDGPRTQACAVVCDDGFGSVESRLHCSNGAWGKASCLRLGSMVRLVARAPELIKPYWVVLDAALYASPDCTDVIRMDGTPISSGEYVIKYANYHPRNAWDGDHGSSWASRTPCAPGLCYLGFHFREPPAPVRCVRVEHPDGRQFQATEVSVETLGRSGWEALTDVTVRLLPGRSQEL